MIDFTVIALLIQNKSLFDIIIIAYRPICQSEFQGLISIKWANSAENRNLNKWHRLRPQLWDAYCMSVAWTNWCDFSPWMFSWINTTHLNTQMDVNMDRQAQSIYSHTPNHLQFLDLYYFVGPSFSIHFFWRPMKDPGPHVNSPVPPSNADAWLRTDKKVGFLQSPAFVLHWL